MENQQQAVKAAIDSTEHALQLLKSAKKVLDIALARDSLITAPPNAFRFMQLPAEIRIKVYRELLLSPHEIDPVYGRDAIALYPAILRVSKQVRDEAEPVMYTENVFTATIFTNHVAKLWHRGTATKTQMPRSSSRKISQLHLYVNTRDVYQSFDYDYPDEPGYQQRRSMRTLNAALAANKLSLNHLKHLKLTINNFRIKYDKGVLLLVVEAEIESESEELLKLEGTSDSESESSDSEWEIEEDDMAWKNDDGRPLPSGYLYVEDEDEDEDSDKEVLWEEFYDRQWPVKHIDDLPASWR